MAKWLFWTSVDFQGLKFLRAKNCAPITKTFEEMAKDALAALQRHFEEQYGKLDMTGAKGKKGKRKQHEEKDEEAAGSDSEEEWRGIQDGNDHEEIQPEPQLVVFTEGEDLNDALDARPSIFMVLALIYLLTKVLENPKICYFQKGKSSQSHRIIR